MSELERPIEKQLRASAEDRRRQAGDPFELHPATRRLLQGEVARQYRRPDPGKAPQRHWFRFWPRLAWSLGTFLVLGMAAFITWQSHQSAQEDLFSEANRSVTNANPSAKTEAAIASAPTPLAPTAGAPTAEPTPVRAPGEVAGSLDAPSQPPPAAITLRTAPTPMRSTSRSMESEGTKTKTLDKAAALADASARRSDASAPPATSSGQTLPAARPEPSALSAAAAPAAAAPMTVTSGAPGRGRAVALPEPSQTPQAYRFYNQAQTPVTNTLVAFTVEQNGTDLKVVDADGSVYTGQVLVADMLATSQSEAVQSRQFGAGGGAGNQALRSQTPPPSQSQFVNQNVLNFRVVGTNRSLRQNVVFTGNFVPADEAANAQVISNVTAIQNNRVSNQNQLRNQQQQLQELLPWNNGRISGQAVLDNKQTIAVEASPLQK